MSEFSSDALPHAELHVREGVVLRQLQPEQAEELFAITDANRQRLAEWLPWVEKTTKPEHSRSFIEHMLESRKAGSEYGYGLFVDGALSGHMGLMHLADEQDPEIGYWIASSAEGQGVTTAAAQALSNFGFETLGLSKIIIRANPGNGGSNRVAEKLGYAPTGTITNEETSKVSNVWTKTKT